MDIVKEKIAQAKSILNELDVDLWMIFCRETDMMADPALDAAGGRIDPLGALGEHRRVDHERFGVGRAGQPAGQLLSHRYSSSETSEPL